MRSNVSTSLDGIDEAAAIVEFYDGKVFMNDEDRDLAIAEGRLTNEAADYNVVPFVKIKFPGRQDLVIDRPAHLEGGGDFRADPVVYPNAWANYKGKGEPITGTPLTVLMALNEGDISHLEDKGLRTVELLEGMTDTQIMSLGMGMRRYRDIARAYQATQPSRDPAAQAELDTLRAELADLRSLLTSPKSKKEAA
jgi:hypothetical protein